MTLTFASTFAGIGGFDLGLERAGMTPVWHCEIDPAASAVLAHHWPEVPNLGDITQIGSGPVQRGADGRRRGDAVHERDVPVRWAERPDLLCGGFPCQDLSVAGRRKGLDGARSGLFFEFARLADELRPRWVLLENVAGLLSSAAGRDFAVLLRTLADIGYEDISWRVVDSLNFGVPQRRRRVLIVGRLGAGTATREVLLEPEGRPWSAPQGGQAGPGAAATLTAGSRSGRGVNPPGRRQEDDVNLIAAQGAVAALSASGVGTCGADDNQAQAGHLIASTLTASAGHHGHSSPRGDGTDNLVPVTGFNARQDPISGEGFVGPLDTRRLTPTECERLQGFPDGWTATAGSDSARYRCLGNAVTVPVIEWIGRRIVAYEAGTLDALSPVSRNHEGAAA